MANTETLASLIQNIASAIREKTQKTDLLTLQQMPSEILSISGGGGLTFDQVIARNYEDLNITNLIVQTMYTIHETASNEEINNYLLRNSTFNNLNIENLEVINKSTGIHSSFLYNSIFNSLTINNFTIDNTNIEQELFFDNPSVEPYQIPSVRINKINCSGPFYFNFSQNLNCLFLNLQQAVGQIYLNHINHINKIILVNDMSSTTPLELYPGQYYNGQVYCSTDTDPQFQDAIQNTFYNVTFISNEECENLWATEITAQP